jgi:hypothetical protein
MSQTPPLVASQLAPEVSLHPLPGPDSNSENLNLNAFSPLEAAAAGEQQLRRSSSRPRRPSIRIRSILAAPDVHPITPLASALFAAGVESLQLDSGNNCYICGNDIINPSAQSASPCPTRHPDSHTHLHCLQAALERDSRCPICRLELQGRVFNGSPISGRRNGAPPVVSAAPDVQEDDDILQRLILEDANLRQEHVLPSSPWQQRQPSPAAREEKEREVKEGAAESSPPRRR